MMGWGPREWERRTAVPCGVRTRRSAGGCLEYLDEILAPEPLIAGSLSQILRRCGKPNCHCVERPSHPSTHLKTSQDGHARCQLVRKADEAEVTEKVNRYRRAKTLLRKLSPLERRRREALQAAIEARRETYS